MLLDPIRIFLAAILVPYPLEDDRRRARGVFPLEQIARRGWRWLLGKLQYRPADAPVPSTRVPLRIAAACPKQCDRHTVRLQWRHPHRRRRAEYIVPRL